MEKENEETSGCLSIGLKILGYLFIASSIYGFILGSIKGNHINDDGEFTTFTDTTNSTLFGLVLGVIFLIISRFTK